MPARPTEVAFTSSDRGCPARSARTPEALDAALAEAMAADTPMLVDVAVDGAIATLYHEKS